MADPLAAGGRYVVALGALGLPVHPLSDLLPGRPPRHLVRVRLVDGRLVRVRPVRGSSAIGVTAVAGDRYFEQVEEQAPVGEQRAPPALRGDLTAAPRGQ